ncbi:MAG: Flp family type IVb pilin [Candidatus Adiutrix sp.]|jgi:pilus assembly protein Flp/PilA|nr:Flp family type IVb pilin [Candidatus Adiutrix sp.]
MSILIVRLHIFLTGLAKTERGVTSIEYGLLAAGVAVVIGALLSPDGSFSDTLDKLFQNILDQLPQASSKK